MNEKPSLTLFQAITQIKEEIIEDADIATFQQKKVTQANWKKWSAAACLCLLLAGSALILKNLGGNSSNLPEDGNAQPGQATNFMSYAGPVFPLTIMETNTKIEAERTLDLDFSSYSQKDENYNNTNVIVKDSYTLFNPTKEDITMTGLYPYVGNLQKVNHPIITIDGNEAETQLYSGSCTSEHERTGQGEITSWEGYKMLLEDGTYLQQACRPDPSLAEPVTVYTFTKITDGGSDSINPTLDMQFTMDYDKTAILTYGFNGSRNDPDTGNTSRNFSIPSMGQPDYDQTRYLIALGEDIGPYTLQGYANGGCDPGTEIQGVSAHVRKYETTLGEILQETASAYYEQFVRINPDTDLAKDVPIEMYFSQIYRSFAQYKSGGELITEQFQDGMLEDIISQILYRNRVFYRAFSITVPAEGQIKICAEIKKEGSFDYACTSGSHAGITGYDMVTQLGSILKFRKQTASISNIQSIEIIRQNFGFDPTNEILTVELSPSVEHYYLEVRTVTDQ